MRWSIAASTVVLAVGVQVVATAATPQAASQPKIVESVTFKGMSGDVTVYSNSSHQALKVEASSSSVAVKLTSHTGQVTSCAKSCTYKTPFAWGSVSYRNGSKTITQLNQAVESERHLPKIREYRSEGKRSFMLATDQTVVRVVLAGNDVTFCRAVDPHPGYLKFVLANGKTSTCPTDVNHGFTDQLKWVSLTAYDTSSGTAIKGDTIYAADLAAANR